MSDVKVVRYLLANNVPLIAVVPASRISAGALPQGTTLPAISVTHVSTVRRQMVAQTVEFCSSRVQVTVMASTYPLLKSTLTLVRAALPRSRGVVNGVQVDSILTDTDGPDFTDEAGLHIGSIDYLVNYTE